MSASESNSHTVATDRSVPTETLDPHTDRLSKDVEASVGAAIRRAEKWLEVEETSKSTQQLADMVHDPNGVEFTFACLLYTSPSPRD